MKEKLTDLKDANAIVTDPNDIVGRTGSCQAALRNGHGWLWARAGAHEDSRFPVETVNF